MNLEFIEMLDVIKMETKLDVKNSQKNNNIRKVKAVFLEKVPLILTQLIKINLAVQALSHRHRKQVGLVLNPSTAKP